MKLRLACSKLEGQMKLRGLLLVGLLNAASVHGQIDPPTLQFTLTNPGARSLGLAGAFAALADDATAAVANPSGLVQIARPEVSLEARGWSVFEGDVNRLTPGLETSSGLTTASGVGFLSFVYPRNDWSFAVYWHRVANIDTNSGISGVIYDPIGSGDLGFVEVGTTSTFDISTYGFSTAYRFNEKLDVGLGIMYFSGDLSSRSGFSYLPGTSTALRGAKIVSVNDGDWGLSAGLIWRPHGQISLGGFYRQAPSFEARAEEFPINIFGEISEPVEIAEGKARFPDVFGAGIVYKSGGASFTASAEWDHVRYSLAGGGIFDETDVTDGDELHLGIEYAFLGITPIIALRTGAWYETDRSVRFAGDSILAGAEIQRGSRWHYALGLGFAISHFQLDLGADISEYVATGSLSVIVSF
jgi:long-subunit fatty acid transport protein